MRIAFIGIFLLVVLPCFAGRDLRCLKDPFIAVKTGSKKSINRKQLVLEGIMHSDNKRSAAILSYGEQRDVVEPGSRFAGYRLLKIAKDFVVVMHGKQRKKLVME